MSSKSWMHFDTTAAPRDKCASSDKTSFLPKGQLSIRLGHSNCHAATAGLGQTETNDHDNRLFIELLKNLPAAGSAADGSSRWVARLYKMGGN